MPQVTSLPVQEVKSNVELYREALKDLGFDNALKKLSMAEKLKVAYAKYGYVSQEKIKEFNSKLYKETVEETNMSRIYKTLVFLDIKTFGELPPYYVLDKMREAMADNIFDRYEIAKIESKVVVKDPILFGIIEGCTDKFFIAQWDDDVSIEEIALQDVSRIASKE